MWTSLLWHLAAGSLSLSHVFIIDYMQIKRCTDMPKQGHKPHGTYMQFNWLKPAYLCLSGLGNWHMWRRSVWGTLCVHPARGSWGPVEVRPNYSPPLQPHNILQLQVSDKVRIKCCRESKVGSVRCGDLSFF